MKDISKLKDYRKKYKRYYGIDFGDDFAIHHMDFDRSNNDIANLLLLPADLHQRYHFYIKAIYAQDCKSGELVIKTRVDEYEKEIDPKMIYGLLSTLQECNTWVALKKRMDAARGENIGDI